jgi:uncharacterized protein with HEPN domain
MRRDAERVSDILREGIRIAGYIDGRTAADFIADVLFQDAVVRQLTVVGEASINLSPEFKARHPEIPWPNIAGFPPPPRA